MTLLVASGIPLPTHVLWTWDVFYSYSIAIFRHCTFRNCIAQSTRVFMYFCNAAYQPTSPTAITLHFVDLLIWFHLFKGIPFQKVLIVWKCPSPLDFPPSPPKTLNPWCSGIFSIPFSPLSYFKVSTMLLTLICRVAPCKWKIDGGLSQCEIRLSVLSLWSE